MPPKTPIQPKFKLGDRVEVKAQAANFLCGAVAVPSYRGNLVGSYLVGTRFKGEYFLYVQDDAGATRIASELICRKVRK